MKTDKYIGLDVHQDTTVIGIVEKGREGEVRLYGSICSDLQALEKGLRKVGGEGVVLHVVYEAGPDWLCDLPTAAAAKDRMCSGRSRENPAGQSTDRRDALQLARLHHAGELTAIHVPDAVDETIRDMTASTGRHSRWPEARQATPQVVSPSSRLSL